MELKPQPLDLDELKKVTSLETETTNEDRYNFEIIKLNRFSNRFQQKRTFRPLNGIWRKESSLRESLPRAANQEMLKKSISRNGLKYEHFKDESANYIFAADQWGILRQE